MEAANAALRRIRIGGFRPFLDFEVSTGPLEVFVGANGTGKSCLFEFLRFLRDSLRDDIPPEIVRGAIGKDVFHRPGPDRIFWSVDIGGATYEGELHGPAGRASIVREDLFQEVPGVGREKILELRAGRGWTRKVVESLDPPQEFSPFSRSRLALAQGASLGTGAVTGLTMSLWEFYESGRLSMDRIRQPAFASGLGYLVSDRGNLSSAVHYLQLEQPRAFQRLHETLRLLIPEFGSIRAVTTPVPGQIVALYRERDATNEFNLADLSDGILRLIGWAVLCTSPYIPVLVAIDEPELGLHPRTLPVLAEMFRDLSTRTQVFLATHSSYFLTQFALHEITVIRREQGAPVARKPANSKVLAAMLEEFGADEIERLHRSEELEQLA